MKNSSILLLSVLLIILLLPIQNLAQELPYKEGTVWEISFIRTKPGMKNDYLKHFADNLREAYEEGKKQGVILSYKILIGNAANREDWNLLLMVEYKNMAALDGAEEKWETINSKIIGTHDQRKSGYVSRSEMRETLGAKIVREIILR